MQKSKFRSKEDYPVVLDPVHIQEILGIGRRQTYELLQNPPFHVVRLGRRGIIKVSSEAFWNWLEGKLDRGTF
jgi:hypothetical protein